MAGDRISSIAVDQMRELKAGADVALYNAVVEACDFVLDATDRARKHSSAVTTAEGVRYRLPVVGYPPYKVFWSSDGPRIEAVFPHP